MSPEYEELLTIAARNHGDDYRCGDRPMTDTHAIDKVLLHLKAASDGTVNRRKTDG